MEENINKQEVNGEERVKIAKEIIKNHTLISAGFGAVPVPIVDIIGLTGTQLSMLNKLSKLYNQEFTKDIAKKSLISLVGGTLSIPMAVGLSSLIKSIPIIGQTAGVISIATVGSASTYAVGEVFLKHFESNGNFLDFDASQFKEYFNENFEKGKKIIKNFKEKEKEEKVENKTENSEK